MNLLTLLISHDDYDFYATKDLIYDTLTHPKVLQEISQSTVGATPVAIRGQKTLLPFNFNHSTNLCIFLVHGSWT